MDMKLYNLPSDKNFITDIHEDLIRAKKVVIVSPFLSFNVIKEWRELAQHISMENFTIVYDIDETLQHNEERLEGDVDNGVISSITWRRLKALHSKIYYFEFEEGFSFYHGSANFTNRGVGSLVNETNFIRNIEIVSRIKDEPSMCGRIQELVNYYIKVSESEAPFFDNEKKIWTSKPDVETSVGIIKEYKKLLCRLEKDAIYEPASSSIVLGRTQMGRTQSRKIKKVQGFFKSKNNRTIKFHTNNKGKEGNTAVFTISKVELKWFLGDFQKVNTNTKYRKLYLVWKIEGDFSGRLIVFRIFPFNIFNLLRKSNRQKKIKVSQNSVRLTVVEKNGAYYLRYHTSFLEIPNEQIIRL